MKKVFLGGLTAVGIGLAVAGNHFASAATTSNTGRDGLIDKIVSKFNLNKSDVQQVFDDHKSEMLQNRLEKDSARLDDLVTKGKITSSQKDLIVNKQKELFTAMQDWEKQHQNEDHATQDFRNAKKDFMQSQRDSLEQWAEDNDIDLKYLRPMGGPRGHHMGGMMDGGPDFDGGNPPADSATDTNNTESTN